MCWLMIASLWTLWFLVPRSISLSLSRWGLMFHFPMVHLFVIFQWRHFSMVLEIPWIFRTSSFMLLTYVMSIPNKKTEFFSPLHLSGRSLWGSVILFFSVTWLSVGHKSEEPISTLIHTTYCPWLLNQDHAVMYVVLVFISKKNPYSWNITHLKK